jgi:2,4-dienoyl-CoA reductase-like NADH-dependent reductase (Old Yellow Enzyme family)
VISQATQLTEEIEHRTRALFQPGRIGSLQLPNRIVMAPMTRAKSPEGVPSAAVAAYYRRRAEGGVALIVSEGTFIPHWSASHERNAPRLYGEAALAGWKRVIDEVHAAGGRMFPQLWHVGQIRKPKVQRDKGVFDEDTDFALRIGPSGIFGVNGGPLEQLGKAASQKDIDEIIFAYGQAARNAQRLEFDGIEVHGAHGYLIDQFLWPKTNLRNDDYGGDIARRGRFGADVIREIRTQVGPDFPLVLRVSTWKSQDYTARLAETPQEWEAIIGPLADAGLDGFHVSQRRFWETEFGSEMNLAGWTKKITGKPTITVGSVTLNNSMAEMLAGHGSEYANNLIPLVTAIERGDFDFVAVGRALIANPDWPRRIQQGAALQPYTLDMLHRLD